MIAIGLLQLLLLSSVPQGEDWVPLWRELSRLREDLDAARTGRKLSFAPDEAELTRSRLVEAARMRGGDPRAELLRAELELLAGRDPTAAAARLARQQGPFSPSEDWFLADIQPPGMDRARFVMWALESPASLALWQTKLAYNTSVDAVRGLHIEDVALPIQQRLHEANHAPWSASDLAVTYRALGDRGASDRVLAETIAREEAADRQAPGLWEERGITALAFGDEVRARDYLGRALASGSDNAELLLSRLDLVAGRTEAARRGFRVLILDQPPPDWAWRGWGLTLLPAPLAPPATKKPPLPNPR